MEKKDDDNLYLRSHIGAILNSPNSYGYVNRVYGIPKEKKVINNNLYFKEEHSQMLVRFRGGDWLYAITLNNWFKLIGLNRWYAKRKLIKQMKKVR